MSAVDRGLYIARRTYGSTEKDWPAMASPLRVYFVPPEIGVNDWDGPGRSGLRTRCPYPRRGSRRKVASCGPAAYCRTRRRNREIVSRALAPFRYSGLPPFVGRCRPQRRRGFCRRSYRVPDGPRRRRVLGLLVLSGIRRIARGTVQGLRTRNTGAHPPAFAQGAAAQVFPEKYGSRRNSNQETRIRSHGAQADRDWRRHLAGPGPRLVA